MDTKLTGTEISKLTACLTGGGFKRANSKEAAIARFVKIASEKGFDKPEQYLAMSADNATQALFSNRPTKKSINIEDMHKSDHPIAKANAAPSAAVPKTGKRKAAIATAEAGELPAPPDFSAKTHERFRKKLAELVAVVKAGNIQALRAFPINPISSSPKALDRYRNLAVKALEARRMQSTRPGDQAAIYAEEAGISYGAALVACNMD